MKNLTNESRYLLYVIRSAVKQQKIDPPSEALDWDEFFALSKKNEIFSLVTTALPTEYLPRDLAQKFDNFTKSEMVRIIAMNNELSTVEKLLNEHGVKIYAAQRLGYSQLVSKTAYASDERCRYSLRCRQTRRCL